MLLLAPPLLHQPPFAFVLQQWQGGVEPQWLILELQVTDTHGHHLGQDRLGQQGATTGCQAGVDHGLLAQSPGLLLAHSRWGGPGRGHDPWGGRLVILRKKVGGALQVALVEALAPKFVTVAVSHC